MWQRDVWYLDFEIRAIARLLDDPDLFIRFWVYQNLHRAGVNQTTESLKKPLRLVVPALLKKLETESPDEAPGERWGDMLSMAIGATGAIGRSSPHSVSALKRVYFRYAADTKRDGSIRYLTIRAIGEIGPSNPEGLPFLFAVFRDTKRPLGDRMTAAITSCEHGPAAAPLMPEIIALLRREANSAEPWAEGPQRTVAAMIQCLALLGELSEPAYPLLIELAQRSERGLGTKQAITALGDLGPLAQDRSLPVLARLCFGKNRHPLQDDLVRAITKFGPAAVPVLRDVLRGGNVDQQTLVADTAATFFAVDSRSLLPDLERIAADRRHPVSANAGRAVQRIRDVAAHLSP